MNEQAALFDAVLLGKDVKAFLDGPVYKHLLACAEYEKQSALVRLATVSPEAALEIRNLQNVVWRCDSFGAWLIEALETARQSQEILESE
jgi:hypothetical protein